MSNYFTQLRAAISSGGDAATQANRTRAQYAVGMRTPSTARAEAIAKRAAYDTTCK